MKEIQKKRKSKRKEEMKGKEKEEVRMNAWNN